MGNGSDLTPIVPGFWTERDELQEPPELIAANRMASDAGNLAPLLGKFVTPGLGDQRVAIGDEELQQGQDRDAENQYGDHRFGTSTLAVAIRASSGTFMKV